MPAKRITPQSITGQLGANLIEHIVLQMKYVWRPLLIFDVGVDGEIEICDPVTGEATNAIIKVQAKATTRPFQAETPESFEYPCEQRDLDYWLRGNAPVILIVCRPDADEAYWVSVKHYFRELSAQKTHKVHFNKLHDRFDVTCATDLKRLALPRDSGTYFAPLPKKELLYTNLLQVASYAPRIHIADTDYRSREDIWGKFNSLGVKVGPEWMLSNKRIMSFHNLEEPPFSSICDLGTHESFDSGEWADTTDKNQKRDFVQLLNLCLKERTRLLGLRFYNNEERKYFYFSPTRDLRTRKVQYQSLQRQARREVFKKYTKKTDPTQRAYCRHSAFKGSFLRVGDEWYLEITPTYHFTRDGYTEDPYREDRLKGIKRLERNPAVIGHLLMWADYLRRPIRSLFAQEYPFLSFGNLARLEIDTGLPDELWYAAEEGQDAVSMKAYENQPRLFGL